MARPIRRRRRSSRQALIDTYWWAGDNLARSPGFNYDGLNVPNKDEQTNPTHGSCTTVGDIGQLLAYPLPLRPEHALHRTSQRVLDRESGHDADGQLHRRLPGHRGRILVRGPCRRLGHRPQVQPCRPLHEQSRPRLLLRRLQRSAVVHQRDGQFHPHKDGTKTGQPIIATLDGVTATRNRARGIWLRPTWIVVKNARLATNRENVTLVSSGGSDGNAPGVWQLLKSSVLVGLQPEQRRPVRPVLPSSRRRARQPQQRKVRVHRSDRQSQPAAGWRRDRQGLPRSDSELLRLHAVRRARPRLRHALRQLQRRHRAEPHEQGQDGARGVRQGQEYSLPAPEQQRTRVRGRRGVRVVPGEPEQLSDGDVEPRPDLREHRSDPSDLHPGRQHRQIPGRGQEHRDPRPGRNVDGLQDRRQGRHRRPGGVPRFPQ